jgi:uncharacterized membrane protein
VDGLLEARRVKLFRLVAAVERFDTHLLYCFPVALFLAQSLSQLDRFLAVSPALEDVGWISLPEGVLMAFFKLV